jgi:hypothetical protein
MGCSSLSSLIKLIEFDSAPEEELEEYENKFERD